MRFLPIVERELRVAARRPTTFRTRFGMALLGTLVGVFFYLAYSLAPPQQSSRRIFEGLAALLLLYCLAAGRRSTADCLSIEKREGTLGLLFLTDLKGYDVVLGKLAATSLNAFYCLLAVLPVLAVPLLIGGISNGQFWRIVLVLGNTFLFSLVVGIFASSLCRDAQRAMGANFGIFLLLAGTLPACGAMVAALSSGTRILHPLFFPCPVYAYHQADDANYALAPSCYWWSMATIHALTWLLALLASWIVPRSWQDRVATPRFSRWHGWWTRWAYGPESERKAFRERLLDINAFYWLAARIRAKPLWVWLFLASMAGWWLWGWWRNGSVWLETATNITAALILNSTFKLWIAIEAGQRLAEDQKAGALELLLSSPLTAKDIIRGQLLALRRQFLLPLVVVLITEVLFMNLRNSVGGDPGALTWLAGMGMLLADVAALVGVAMAMALRAKNPNLCAIFTIWRVLILPWVAYAPLAVGVSIAANLTARTPPTWGFYLGLWVGLGLAADLGFGLTAWWQLRNRFRRLAEQRFLAASHTAA